jgi:hypothetical protein
MIHVDMASRRRGTVAAPIHMLLHVVDTITLVKEKVELAIA